MKTIIQCIASAFRKFKVWLTTPSPKIVIVSDEYEAAPLPKAEITSAPKEDAQ